MKRMIAILLMLVSVGAVAEPVTLLLPQKVTLSFDAPPMTKLREVSQENLFQYLASSAGSDDERFSLSIYVEPIDCQHGSKIKQIAECFLERSDQIPGINKESRSTRCDRSRCEIMYVTVVKAGETLIRQLHTNTLFTYGGEWVDVHFSVLNPAQTDGKMLARFAGSLKLAK